MGIDPYQVSYLDRADNWLEPIAEGSIDYRGGTDQLPFDRRDPRAPRDSSGVKGKAMKMLILCFLLVLLVPSYAESQLENAKEPEPNFYEHYLSMKRMQESLAGRSLDEQARLQSSIQRAERHACEQLKRERHKGVPKEDYRRQGGDEFLVFSLQFEQYCETLR